MSFMYREVMQIKKTKTLRRVIRNQAKGRTDK